MKIINWLKNIIFPEKNIPEENYEECPPILFRVGVIEFADNTDSESGLRLAKMIGQYDDLQVFYFDEPFGKNFLTLESRTIFDLIDKGQDILDRTQTDVIIWGYREGDKIRLNFQTSKQYEYEDKSFVTLLDSLYIPAITEQNSIIFPPALLNIIHGAIISAISPNNTENKIYRRYLLKKIIHELTNDTSAKNLPTEFTPYIMNFLGIIFLSYAYDEDKGTNFKTIYNILNTALKHQDKISNPIHLGCIYYHIGQLYDSATLYTSKNPSNYYKGAIEYYRRAQKYLSKYNYPYDYGYISYKLAILFFNYWKQKEDIQALRDAVFQLREAEKIYTYAVFPNFWAEIQGKLGQMLALLGSFSNSAEISELAINAYKNRQKVISEKRYPLNWGRIQEYIAEIHYHLGQRGGGDSHFEEAMEYFHDALYMYENAQLTDEIKKVKHSINKCRQYIHNK